MQNRDPYNPFESSTQTDPSTGSGTSTTAGTMDKMKETASEIRNRASEAGRSAGARMEEGRRSAAGALDRAADALHRKAERIPGGMRTTDLAHTTADKLHNTAHYLRDHDLKDMMGDFENVVRRRPGQALLGALAVGFLVGRAIRKEH